MVDISDWAVFARAAELSSLSAAGRDLRMSAAVVSNRVAKLEKHLGVRLLNRTTRRVSLTEEGTLFYEHCMQIPGGIRALTTDRVTITPWSLNTSIQSLSSMPAFCASTSEIQTIGPPRDNVSINKLSE